MKATSLAVIVILFLVIPLLGPAAEPPHYEDTNQAFRLHGRLSAYEGNPRYRIWIIGTKRILGVPGGDQKPPAMPQKLEALMSGLTDIYADFHVTPLTEYQKGVMQWVRIDSVENVVIYRSGKFVAKRKKP